MVEHNKLNSSDADEVLAHESPDEVSRRQFMRKSAEVAVFSLFGLTAFDPLLRKVLDRMGENQALHRLADGAANRLKSSGFLSSAQADSSDCNSQPVDDCIHEYNCHTGQDVSCDIFHCKMDPWGCTERENSCSAFDCDPAHNCSINEHSCVSDECWFGFHWCP